MNKEFKSTVDSLNKQSPNFMYKLGDDSAALDIKRKSTGVLSIDIAIGGGAPEGRIIEIYGGESAGKTTIAMHMIAEAQKRGETCYFVDYEHAFNKEYAKELGIDVDGLWISQPSYAEEGLNAIDRLIDSKEIDLIVVDSVAAMTPLSELKGDIGDSSIGVQARLMSQTFRKITAKASKTGTTIVFINQTRDKIGVMFGNPETTSGGKALKFYASIRMSVNRGAKNEEKGLNQGKVKIVKNKTFPPYKIAEYDMIHGKGISKESDLIEIGSTLGIVTKAGSWYSYEGSKLGQGKDNAGETLRDNPEIAEEIEHKIKAWYFPTPEQKKQLEETKKETKDE